MMSLGFSLGSILVARSNSFLLEGDRVHYSAHVLAAYIQSLAFRGSSKLRLPVRADRAETANAVAGSQRGSDWSIRFAHHRACHRPRRQSDGMMSTNTLSPTL